MALDLTKLNPAPWAVEVIETFSVIRDEHTCGAMLLPEDDDNENHLAALEFAALARNAFDVLLRRGWTLYRDGGGWWIACESMSKDGVYSGPIIRAKDGSLCWYTGLCDNPFSALVAADEWYKANVEAKQQ